MTAFVVVSCVAFGLAIGSFLNVVVWRVPRGESVVSPPSRCPACETPIAARDNVPVLSWLLLRGRCRHCGSAISARYPLVELGNAALFGVVGWRFADSWVLPAYLVLAAALLALSLIDLEHLKLPNRVVYPAGILVALLLVLASALEDDWGALVRAAVAGAGYFVVFFVLWFLAPRALGFGDVRLAVVLGMALGWTSVDALLLGMFLPLLLGTVGGIAVAAPRVLLPMVVVGVLGALVGADVTEWLRGEPPSDAATARAVVGVFAGVLAGSVSYLWLSYRRRVERGRAIPFGPYLAAGALLSLLIHGS